MGEWVQKSIPFTCCAECQVEHTPCKIPEEKEECEQLSVEKALPKTWVVLATREANHETECNGEPHFVGFPAHLCLCHVVSELLGCTIRSGLRQLKARTVFGADS